MPSRRPTYAAPMRLARLALILAATPNGVPFEELDDLLGVSERTRYRYVRLLRETFGAHLDLDDRWVTLRPGWDVAFRWRPRRRGVA